MPGHFANAMPRARTRPPDGACRIHVEELARSTITSFVPPPRTSPSVIEWGGEVRDIAPQCTSCGLARQPASCADGDLVMRALYKLQVQPGLDCLLQPRCLVPRLTADAVRAKDQGVVVLLPGAGA